MDNAQVAGDRDWQRLADRVTKRRTELGLTQSEVQAAGGPSTATMRLIEGAMQSSYRATILGRLERALQWEPGSVERVLEGGEPAPRAPGQPERRNGTDRELDPDVRRWMAILADPNVPEPQKRLMREQMRIWEQQIEAARETGTGAQEQRRHAS